jgi:hypothetical protein
VHPFECSYHFIQLPAGEHLLLDVVRQRSREGARLFLRGPDRARAALLVLSEEGQFSMTSSRLLGASPDLDFDLRFEIERAGAPVPVVNPANFFDVSACDHLNARYTGTLRFRERRFAVEGAFGTMSHHYGRRLPDYLYLCTLPSSPADDHVVGSLVRIGTKASESPEHDARAFYLWCARGEQVELHVAPEVPLRRPAALAPGFIIESGPLRLHIELDGDEPFVHELMGVTTMTYLHASLRLDRGRAAPLRLPCIVEWRGFPVDDAGDRP